VKELKLERQEKLLDRELKVLTEAFEKFQEETRAQFDKLELEVKALQAFFETHSPEFKRFFKEIRAQVFKEVNPEL
jgi:septal ring factor EnvC (AmiA/AmiB activator)